MTFTSCDHLLDSNRYPETSIVNDPAFWSNANNCQQECNRMYQYFYGYGSGSGYGNFYFNTLSDDQCGSTFAQWKFQNVPTSSSTYNTAYTVIRGCNIIIENVNNSSLTDVQKRNFIGQARLMRGYEYANLVKYYGDVILVEGVLDLDSPELTAERTDRKTVADYALADFEYAAENIAAKNGIQVFSRDLAKAMLSEFCLTEGTFWKYCTLADNYYAPDAARSQKFLELCVKYSDGLINDYPISSDYHALYNSTWSGDANAGVTSLSKNTEVIFATQYEKDQFMHSTIDYTCSSTTQSGISKDAFDAYLFKDGLPKAKTKEDTNDVPVYMAEGVAGSDNGTGLSIEHMLAVRDQRLAATIDPYVYYKGQTWARGGAMQSTSSTGYGIAKYDNPLLPEGYRDVAAKNYTSCPLYWGAVICLNYAEAKAELGTLTDADMNRTLNKLYARAGLPSQTVASLTAINDPANNMGVSSLLWEVRRCRRCELIMDNDFRYWDLVRWHQLELLDTNKHPNIMLGAAVPANAPIQPAVMSDGYINASLGQARVYEARQYVWPLPADQMGNLNPNLKQNENWK